MGEFLSTYGRIGKQVGKIKPAATYAAGAMAGKSLAENPPSIVSEAEAADKYSPFVNRGRQIEEATGDNALATRAAERVPQESAPRSMNAQELAAYDAETRRMKESKNALGKPKEKKKYRIKQVTVRTKDGEELRYKDLDTGKLYQDDPNF